MASSQWIWVTVIGRRNPQREKLEFSFGLNNQKLHLTFFCALSVRKRAELRDVGDNSEEELYDAIHLDLEAH